MSTPTRRTSWLPWIVMAVVLGAALTFGTITRTRTLTNADRLVNISRSIKCPVCTSESVAESDAGVSVEIRADIGKRLAAGQTDDQIRQAEIDQYGAYLSLTPSSTGVTSLVWIIPVVVLIIALAVLVLVFRRWQQRVPMHATDADRALVDAALGGPATGASGDLDRPGGLDELIGSDELDDPEQGSGR